MNIVVTAPSENARDLGELPAGVRLAAYSGIDDLLQALRDNAGPGVLWSDGIAVDGLEAAAQAVRQRPGAVIEVRGERWDGETFSPLSAACRGVISGFGAAGVAEALRLLAASAA